MSVAGIAFFKFILCDFSKINLNTILRTYNILEHLLYVTVF